MDAIEQGANARYCFIDSRRLEMNPALVAYMRHSARGAA